MAQSAGAPYNKSQGSVHMGNSPYCRRCSKPLAQSLLLLGCLLLSSEDHANNYLAELTVHAHKGHHSTINIRVRNPRRLATHEQLVRADVERATDPKQRDEVGFSGIGHVPGVSGLAQAQAFGDLGVG
nr:hypothetical protein [Nitrospirillum amazonense]